MNIIRTNYIKGKGDGSSLEELLLSRKDSEFEGINLRDSGKKIVIKVKYFNRKYEVTLGKQITTFNTKQKAFDFLVKEGVCGFREPNSVGTSLLSKEIIFKTSDTDFDSITEKESPKVPMFENIEIGSTYSKLLDSSDHISTDSIKLALKKLPPVTKWEDCSMNLKLNRLTFLYNFWSSQSTPFYGDHWSSVFDSTADRQKFILLCLDPEFIVEVADYYQKEIGIEREPVIKIVTRQITELVSQDFTSRYFSSIEKSRWIRYLLSSLK